MSTPKVNKEACIGCGTCAALAGNTFKMEDDGKAVVFNPTGDDAETIKMAADSCPVQCISLE